MGYTSFYDRHNRCKQCKITYPKEFVKCLNCGLKLSTKRKVYATQYAELKEARRAHTRI